MAIGTGTGLAITAATRILAPLITDIYKSAKDAAGKGLRRWQETAFPRRLAKRINCLAQVRTLWSPDDDVSLVTFYYPPCVLREKRERRSVESITELGDGNIVIQGIVGQGKSIFLRHLAIKAATDSGKQRLPVFLELRTLQGEYTLIPAIYKTLSAYDIEVDDYLFDHLAKSGNLVLLLDAFDELDENLVRLTLTDISFLGQKYPELQIIVTSRPGNEIQKASGFRTTRILPLRHSDYGPFLRRMGLNQTKVFEIEEAIKASPSKLIDLISTPLMLTLVVIVYESEKEIPPTLPEFFERLFQVVFTRHDRLKAGFTRKLYSGLSERRLQSLFEAFCFMVLQNSFGRSLSSEQFSIAFDQAIEYAEDSRCDEQDFKLDMTKVACLMLEEGLDITTFLHKSVLEYYAAAFIKHSSDEVARLFYKAAEDNYKNTWHEVIRFLADIDPYRYAKEFAMVHLPVIRNEFIEPLEVKDDRTLLKVITGLYPSFSVGYHRIDGSYTLASFGPFEARQRNIIYEQLDGLLISAMEQMLPQEMSCEELEQLTQRQIDPEDFEVEVPLYDAIQSAGSGEIWDAVHIFRGRLEQMEVEAQLTIDRQDKRKLIFQAKKF